MSEHTEVVKGLSTWGVHTGHDVTLCLGGAQVAAQVTAMVTAMVTGHVAGQVTAQVAAQMSVVAVVALSKAGERHPH